MRLWWGKRENVDLVALENGMVCFQADRQLKPGRQLKARAYLPGGENFQALLKVIEPIPASEFLESHVQALGYAPKRFFYHGNLEQPRQALEHLEHLLEPMPEERPKVEREPRVRRSIKVVSPDLMNFHGYAHDLSNGGVCMVTEGPLETGRRLPLKLQLDAGFEPIELEAEVRWCKPQDDVKGQGSHILQSRFLVGARFLQIDRHKQRRLADFVEQSGEREPGVIEDRQYFR